MIRIVGEIILYIALFFSILQSFIPLYAYYRKNPYLLALARPSALAQFVALLFAYILLTIAFVNNDFSIAYVAANSHPALPLMYRLTAVWGAHEGSILFWTFILSAWTITFSLTTHKKVSIEFSTLTIAVLGLLSFCFLIFLIFTSNPFLSSLGLHDGQDLNPLLQDPGFLIHPPMLYIGYVGFATTFAMTQAALIQDTIPIYWAQISKKFALLAWCFLTLGITLGSWWAYRVLGWGGFWFWDPVENASLLPWLAGTALIHVLTLVEKKGIAISWAIILADFTFILSLLGTFLVRSGVLVSSHTFANDPARGILLLCLFVVVASGALMLFLSRMKSANNKNHSLLLFSRETSLLINSALLFVAMLTILLGTIYPLIIESLKLGKISVGAPYFNKVMTPFTFMMMFFMGLGSLCSWQAHYHLPNLRAIVVKNLLLSIVIGSAICYALTNEILFIPTLTLILSFWIILSVFKSKYFIAPIHFAHIGFASLIVGIMMSSWLQQEIEIKMKPGDTLDFANYHFLFKDTRTVKGENFRGIQANFNITKGSRQIVNLYPEKRIYPVRDAIMTTVAIHPSIFRDLYIALGEPLDQQYWSVRVYYKPFVRFIWAGGLLMLSGGLLALIKKMQALKLDREGI